MSILISIIGALVAILVSIISAILANRNNIILQTRKLKEEHYIAYIEALHNLAANNNNAAIHEYTNKRDKLLLIANEDVIIKLFQYENNTIGKDSEKHDKYLTELYKAIRRDLKLKSKRLPIINLKK